MDIDHYILFYVHQFLFYNLNRVIVTPRVYDVCLNIAIKSSLFCGISTVNDWEPSTRLQIIVN